MPEAEEQSEDEPLPDVEELSFDELRERTESYLADDARERARDLLDEAVDIDGSRGSLDDEVWLHRTLGEVLEENDEPERAAEAYLRGYRVEPRELSILRPLAALLLDEDVDIDVDDGIAVLQTLLTHHQGEIEAAALADVHAKLGAFHEERDDFERARSFYEQAVAADPGHRDGLTGLLRVVGAVGTATDVVEVRRQLIDSFDETEERSDALVALGDDWVERFNDPARAIDSYEHAIDEHPDNLEAHERLLKTARQMGDWPRVYQACRELGRLADDDEERADWLFEASEVARDKLWEPHTALAGFRRALELQPTKFEAFKAVTSILFDARDWEGLEQAYLEAIDDYSGRDEIEDEVMAVLWRNLGDLYHLHLERPESAVQAYHNASEYVPQNTELHEQVADLAESEDVHLELAVEHLRILWQRDRSRLDALDRLGRLYLRTDQIDRAVCHFRVIEYLGGELGERPREFVERFKTGMHKTPDETLNWGRLLTYVVPDELDRDITDVFRILYPVLFDWVAERRSEYGLSRRDRVDLEEPLAFNNIYKSVAESLGYDDLPQLWRKSSQRGLLQGALKPEALIVGDDLMTSGDEKRMAFAVGRKLFLMYKPFYVVGLRSIDDLQAFFLLAMQLVRSDVDVDRTREMETAYRKIEKEIRGERRDELAEAVEAATGGADEIVLGDWVEAVEDAANRVGMVFADDLEVCENQIRRDPQSFSERSPRQRIQNLARWAVAEEFLEFRQKYGLAVDS